MCGQQFYDKALYQKHFAKHFDERTELPNLAALTTFKKVVDPVKDEFDEGNERSVFHFNYGQY